MIWSNKRRRQVLLHLLYATLLKAHVCWYTNRCNFSTIRIPTLLNVSVCTITTCVDCMWVSVCVLVKIFSSEDGGGVLVPSPFQLKNLLRRQHCNDGGSSGTLSTKNSKWNNVKIFSLSKILLFLPIHLICLLGFWIFQSKLLHTFLVLKWFQYRLNEHKYKLVWLKQLALIFGPTKLEWRKNNYRNSAISTHPPLNSHRT